MALLIPLLLPHIIEAGTNLGIGISNAIQGDASSISFQIGGKVFSSRKSFNFNNLPSELRIRIIEEALEESRSYIILSPMLIDPLAARMMDLQRQVPLSIHNENYRNISGDRVSANGYPISSWRWQTISSEWREVLRERLWVDLDVVAFRPYSNLISIMEDKKGVDMLRNVKSVTLREGFSAVSDLYTILSCPALDNLEHFSLLPDYPTPNHPLLSPIAPFPFGLQLIRTRRPRLKSLTYGFPLEATTNEASRQQLAVLKPARLTLSFIRPTIPLFTELKDLVSESTDIFTIRYIPSTTLCGFRTFLCDPLQSFKRIHLLLYFPRPISKFSGPFGLAEGTGEERPIIAEFLASIISALESEPEDVQERYRVWRMENWDIPGAAAAITRKRLWPPGDVLFEMDDPDADPETGEANPHPLDFGDDHSPDRSPSKSKGKGKLVMDANDEDDRGLPGVNKDLATRRASMSAAQQAQSPGWSQRDKSKHWDRETNLRLLGGLVNLRMESKKH